MFFNILGFQRSYTAFLRLFSLILNAQMDFLAVLFIWSHVHLLPSAYIIRWEGTVFTGVCLLILGGAPSPSHNTSTGPMSFLGVLQWLVPGPFSKVPFPWGLPQWLVPGPFQRVYPGQVKMGVPWPGPDGGGTPARSRQVGTLAGSGQGYPSQRLGTPVQG